MTITEQALDLAPQTITEQMTAGGTITGQVGLAYDPLQLRDGRGMWASEGDVLRFTGSMGVPRRDMPQLSGVLPGGRYAPSSEVVPQFLDRMRARGVTVTREHVPARSLKPVQATGDARIVRSIADSIGDATKPAVVSSDDRVVDGTHTWAARLLADSEEGTDRGLDVVRVGMPASDLLGEMGSFAAGHGIRPRQDGEIANPAFRHVTESATITSQALELIGDGHGRHVPGTPMVYKHGWKPVSGGAAGPVLAGTGRFGTVDSLHAHTRPDGALTPERQALHDRIVMQALAGHSPQLQPTATFMGGGPASGKSHLPGPGGPQDSVHIDPDQIKELLPEYNAMQARGEGTAAAAYTHEESSALSKRIEAEAIGNRMNLTLDGVGNSTAANMTRRIEAAKAAGYRVRGRYVTISTEEALRRNRTRLAETARWVPEVVIRDKHAKVSRVFPHLVDHGLLDEAELWDNNVPKGSEPRLIGSKAAGGQWQVHDPAAYQRFLDKAGDAPA